MGQGTLLEVLNGSLDTRGGTGRVEGPRGGLGRYGRLSRRSGTGRETFEEVWDGSGDAP